MKHRDEGYALLQGNGIEIGAFCAPAALPEHCRTRYFDALDPREAARRFPEVDEAKLVAVDIVGDIDKRDLRKLEPMSLDFVIANHVIEHVACPIAMIEDVFRLLNHGGKFAISAPDKRFTFDKDRSLTPFSHLEAEFREGVETVDDHHYLDFLRHTAPRLFEEPGRDIAGDIAFARSRREHAHVWDSDSFRDFLKRCQPVLGVDYSVEYCSPGEENGIECFTVLAKTASR